MKKLYVRTTMTVPEVGTAIHIAELEEISNEACSCLLYTSDAADEQCMV